MSQSVVLEGTGAELIRHLEAHQGQRFRLMTLSETGSPENAMESRPRTMGEALEIIARLNKKHPQTDGSDSLRYLREGRDGEMYDYDPDK